MNPASPELLNPFRPPVGLPVIAEQTHDLLGDEMADALTPLRVYCTRQDDREELTEWQLNHVAVIRNALAVFAAYDVQFEDLLALYRERLATAQAQLAEQVQPLEMALVQAGPDWRGIGLRLLNRLYQHEPGLALACQRAAVEPKKPLNWEAICYRLIERLYQHEPAPAPSPFVARVRKQLDTPGMTARAALPLAERQLLASVTSASLDKPAA